MSAEVATPPGRSHNGTGPAAATKAEAREAEAPGADARDADARDADAREADARGADPRDAEARGGARSPAARIGALIALALLFLGFAALGTWQVERRAWKLDLIERVDRRIHAAPVAAPGPAQWPGLNRVEDEYLRVTATGHFVDAAETRVQAVTELGAGFWVMTPLQTEGGSVILVNRGFVDAGRATVAAAPADSSSAGAGNPVTVVGLLRLSEPGGGFLRRNDPTAGRWYSRDVAAIAAARGLAGSVAPYFIDAGASSALASSSSSMSSLSSASASTSASTDPVGGLTVVAFSNNHLVYALTWYGLALLVVVAAWQVVADKGKRRPARRGRAPT